jgi:archaellum component FlaG (FlaF/FlaG flagellin family)
MSVKYPNISKSREERLINYNKSYSPKIVKSKPSNLEGSEGDIAMGNTVSGMRLYIKLNNQWHAFSPTTIDNIVTGNLSVTGNATITATAYLAGTTIAIRPPVTNLADDGSIPITTTCVNIDANGGNRTGIRFAEAGIAGQIIIVNNTGGETLTFHANPVTSLVRGIATDKDTMEPLGMFMFVSDGSRWNLIGGGALPNEGLTAS